MSVTELFAQSSYDIEQLADDHADSAYESFCNNPVQPFAGILPNGETFRWGLLSEEAIPDMLELQDDVADAATEHEQKFLIKRTRDALGESMVGHDHLYWGAWVGTKLVAFFGLGEKDEEISDGRGDPTPLKALGVTRHEHVDILKAAQVHPAYRNQSLASLAAATRYQYFLNDPKKRVLMTKIHQDNEKVIHNYTSNGFAEACRSTVNDRGETFDVITYMADRNHIQQHMATKGQAVIEKFALVTDGAASKYWKSLDLALG